MKIKASPGFVLIKPLEAEKTTTASGIVLNAPIEQSNVIKAEIISIGGPLEQGGSVIAPPAEKGDTIYFNKSNSASFKEGDVKYLFIPFSGVLGVIK